MKAWRIHELTGQAGLRLDEVDDPAAPDPAAVKIEVHAAGVGFVDTLMMRGLYQVRRDPPFTPGMEVAGIVTVAPEGSGVTVGQRVYATMPIGGCAEYLWVTPAQWIAPLPAGLSFVETAAMAINDHTMYVALTRRGGLRPDECVLVHGASGGVGNAAVRIAVALGARVIAIASTPEGRGAARAAGAHEVHPASEWFDSVRAAGGADVIVDPVGGDAFDASIRALAPEGRLLTMGYASGRIPSVPANRLLLRNADVRGVLWGELMSMHQGLFRQTAAELEELLAAGMPTPRIVEYDFTDGARAFADIEQRAIVGKPVLRVR